MKIVLTKVVVWLLSAAVVGLLIMAIWLQWQANRIATRSHNLDVLYRSLTCDDLPLGSDTSVEACEQAMGKFMLPERRLFGR